MILVIFVAGQEIVIFWAHRYCILNQFVLFESLFFELYYGKLLILKKQYQLIFPAVNKSGYVCDSVKIWTSSNGNTDCYTYTKYCNTLYIILKKCCQLLYIIAVWIQNKRAMVLGTPLLFCDKISSGHQQHQSLGMPSHKTSRSPEQKKGITSCVRTLVSWPLM